VSFLVTVFFIISAIALLLLPRRLAALPLLVGTCYITLGQKVEIGPLSFTVLRLLIIVGVVRTIRNRETLPGGFNILDRYLVLWAAWALFSSLFHQDPSTAFVNRLGMAYNACGMYFLLRIFCQSKEEIVGLCKVTALLLVPIAAEMVYERVTAHNLFSALGGVPATPSIRLERVRAQGPFAHSILAGSVGAICLPLMIAIWREHRMLALVGAAACSSMVFCSSSSGPVMSTLAAVGALYMWRYRAHVGKFRWVALWGYIALDIVMQAPAYYIIAHIDITGGSTAWHRARLIDSAFRHFSEWWLWGTDYTRHWMATGVPWSADHADITNHYLGMGVRGGLILMLLFIGLIVKAFSCLGVAFENAAEGERHGQFVIWALGSALFVITVTCISVGFFDQSILFVYLILAASGSVRSGSTLGLADDEQNADSSEDQESSQRLPVAG